MKFYYELKHFITKHPKELFYFLVIYFIPLFLSFFIFRFLIVRHYSTVLIILSLILPSIPACLYTEYSYGNIGYRSPAMGALLTFLILNSSLIFNTFKLNSNCWSFCFWIRCYERLHVSGSKNWVPVKCPS